MLGAAPLRCPPGSCFLPASPPRHLNWKLPLGFPFSAASGELPCLSGGPCALLRPGRGRGCRRGRGQSRRAPSGPCVGDTANSSRPHSVCSGADDSPRLQAPAGVQDYPAGPRRREAGCGRRCSLRQGPTGAELCAPPGEGGCWALPQQTSRGQCGLTPPVCLRVREPEAAGLIQQGTHQYC